MRRRNAIGSQAVVAFPSTRTSPADGVSKRLTSFSVVVLPQPDSPNNTSVSPRSTVRFRSESIVPAVGIEKLTLRNWTSELSAASVICWLSLRNLCVPLRLCGQLFRCHRLTQRRRGTQSLRREKPHSIGEQQITAKAFLGIEPCS